MKITKSKLRQIIKEEIEEVVFGSKIGFSFKSPRPLTDSAIFGEKEEEVNESLYSGTAMPEDIDAVNDALYLLGNVERTLENEEGAPARRARKDVASAADLIQKALGHMEQGELQFTAMRRAALQKSRS
jgi:hypothetical protein